jgi:hypothetical protein
MKMSNKKISRQDLLKAERDRIADNICNDKNLLNKVHEIMLRLCISGYKKIVFSTEFGNMGFMGVFLPAECCNETITGLKNRHLTRSDLNCFRNSRIPPNYFHDVAFYTILRDIFYLILFMKLRDFLKQRDWVKYRKYDDLGKLIPIRLTYTMANKFAEIYTCGDFFRDWENKSARYVLSGKHRKEVELNVW